MTTKKETPRQAAPQNYYVGVTSGETLISIKDSLRNYNKKHGETVFLQNNRLVRVTPGDDEEFTTQALSEELARLILTDTGAWVSTSAAGKEKIGNPPRDVLRETISYGHAELGGVVPTLKGLHDGVLIDSEWQIVNRKGYNAATRLYLKRDYTTPEIPETITEETIKDIKDMFWQIFREFCFSDTRGEDSVDYQNTLVAFVSLVIRPMWKGALPIWTVSKSSILCGGTLLQRIVGSLAMGVKIDPTPFPKNNEELEKTINSVITRGERYYLLDNVPPGRNWVTTNLLTLSTGAGKITFRKLGTNETTTGGANTMFVANGINLDIRADITRRINPVRLVLKGRWQDSHHTLTADELEANARNLHPLAVWAVAVLHKYWIQKGKPAPHECAGNVSEYKKWYYEVCGMLEAAGYTHILDNLRNVQTIDNDADAVTAGCLNALWELFRKTPFTATDLTQAILNEAEARKREGKPGLILPFLNEKRVAAAIQGTLSSTSIGMLLGEITDTVVTGSTCKLIHDRTMGSRYYCLVDVGERQ